MLAVAVDVGGAGEEKLAEWVNNIGPMQPAQWCGSEEVVKESSGR